MSGTIDTTGYLSEPFVGLTIDGRWTIRQPLGEGGMGEVFLATDEQLLSRQVVVKFLKNQALQSAYLRNKFKHEMESLIKARDAGVVQIYGAGTLPDGLPYIVMELIEGESLQAVLARSGAMTFMEVADIAEQLGNTLAAVHEAGIIHRDIKPSNIMLCRKERGFRVKLIDFGIARVTDSLVAASTEFDHTVGTLVYMSPEQLFGSSKTLTPASDVYSLALVAYEMLTGCRVFAPTSAVHLHKLHEAGVHVLPRHLRDEIPAAAQNVLLRALEFEPEKRYQQASEFGDALARALTNNERLPPRREHIAVAILPYQEAAFTPAAATPAGFHANKPQHARSSRLAVVVALALVLLTGAAALIWFAVRRADNRAERDESATAASVQPVEREFAYSLMVTPMKDGKPLQKAFAAAPTQTFLSGWQFTLRFNSQQDGFLYLLNEGSDERGAKLLRILFPHPENNAALSAAVKANQQIETQPSAFDSNPGIEKLWVVMSARKIPELERIKHLVNSTDMGAIRDAEQSHAIQDFLKQHNDPKPLAELNKATNSVTVKARNEVLIEFIELYHN
jgi:tRNA A-37 threonylcarbamoyl transferase component Bud32